MFSYEINHIVVVKLDKKNIATIDKAVLLK